MIVLLILTQAAKSGNRIYSINFDIVNYKQCFSIKDDVKLKIINRSKKAIWFAIGRETLDGASWGEYIMDVRNPRQYQSVEYELLKPNKVKILTIKLKDLDYRIPSRMTYHGPSKPVRFILKIGSQIGSNELRIPSKEFNIIY